MVYSSSFLIYNAKMTSSSRLQVVLKHLQGSVHASTRRKETGQYVYTLDNNLLTEQQRAFYEENGFLVIPKLMDDDLIEECSQRFVEICEGKVDKGNLIILNNKIQDIVWDEVLSKYIFHPKILQYVECFIGPNITAVHSMMINNPPDTGKLTTFHRLHQDLHYFPFRPANKIVTSWTAMERITVENGCRFVISGTHKGNLQPHAYPKNDANKEFHGVKRFDLSTLVNLEMEKGDTVFFHPLIIYGSGPNISTDYRKAISCNYASNDCYFIDVKGTTQNNIAEEVKELAKRRGFNFNFQDICKMRQRIIKGEPGQLN